MTVSILRCVVDGEANVWYFQPSECSSTPKHSNIQTSDPLSKKRSEPMIRFSKASSDRAYHNSHIHRVQKKIHHWNWARNLTLCINKSVLLKKKKGSAFSSWKMSALNRLDRCGNCPKPVALPVSSIPIHPQHHEKRKHKKAPNVSLQWNVMQIEQNNNRLIVIEE